MRQRKEAGGPEPEPRKRRSPRGVAKPAFAPNPMDLQKLRAGEICTLLLLNPTGDWRAQKGARLKAVSVNPISKPGVPSTRGMWQSAADACFSTSHDQGP